MKILVCGSRGWNNPAIMYDVLSKLPKDTIIINGAAPGADRMSTEIGHYNLGLKIISFPPDWNKYGKAAGFIRNKKMLDEKPDKVIAFWDGTSKGTKHTMDEAEKRGIEVEVVKEVK